MACNIEPGALHILLGETVLALVVDAREEAGQVAEALRTHDQTGLAARGAQQVHYAVVLVEDAVSQHVHVPHILRYQSVLLYLVERPHHEPLQLVLFNHHFTVVSLLRQGLELHEDRHILRQHPLQSRL